jgi:hypothetical protein
VWSWRRRSRHRQAPSPSTQDRGEQGWSSLTRHCRMEERHWNGKQRQQADAITSTPGPSLAKGGVWAPLRHPELGVLLLLHSQEVCVH